jgi:hypothetical protein
MVSKKIILSFITLLIALSIYLFADTSRSLFVVNLNELEPIVVKINAALSKYFP